jgi:hypothetical protein
MLQTEFEFTLPKGYVGSDGTLHKQGMMLLATAADEILPLRDPRVKGNQAYLLIILLSRVVTRLGELPEISTKVVEGLFSSDLAYLQNFYSQINENGHTLMEATCPDCKKTFAVDLTPQGE